VSERIRELLSEIAAGWNEGDPKRAAGCFTDDATYLSPHTGQVFVGRRALEQFFHGDGPRPRPMTMTWHHLGCDADGIWGLGEYTFTIPGQLITHGVAVVTVRDGLVCRWREYSYAVDVPFADYVDPAQYT
jgi:ketosteroid isomerase-like protein